EEFALVMLLDEGVRGGSGGGRAMDGVEVAGEGVVKCRPVTFSTKLRIMRLLHSTVLVTFAGLECQLRNAVPANMATLLGVKTCRGHTASANHNGVTSRILTNRL